MNIENVSLKVGQMPAGNASASRKPRLALMGEFSAGKSTLANMLIGVQHLPVQVTATQLPPVWISQGNAPPYRVDLEGKSIPVSLARLEDVPIVETAYIRMFEQSDILSLCDIIDMPGISDPNMPAAVWQRVLPQADGVIWCTHATQAWRQSESAIWATMTPQLQQRSLLLLTRIDKIVADRDRDRIVKRVAKETTGQFSGPCLPISLTRAIAARNDPIAFEAAGATAFFSALTEVLQAISVDLGHQPDLKQQASLFGDAHTVATVLPRRIRPDAGFSGHTPRPPLGAIGPEISALRAIMRGDGR